MKMLVALVALVSSAVEPAYPPLPTGVSSLGAIVCGDYLYVYGGHAGKTHSYDTETVLGTFHRLKLNGGTKWEELPGGPKLQGMNLTTHNGKVYRVGGMQPRNKPGDPSDTMSVPDAARFDPASGRWEALPPLPAGSSHELVTAGDKLVVVGGWQMRGKGEKPVWHDTTLVLDLTATAPEWKALPQPFKRRALTGVALGSKVYVLGGLGESGADRKTDVLDVETGKWSEAAALPGEVAVGFSPAACVLGGRVVVSTSDGALHRLSGDAWERVGETTGKRRVARLVPINGNTVALIGGASSGGNATAIEVVTISK